jgi:hypothetical protein
LFSGIVFTGAIHHPPYEKWALSFIFDIKTHANWSMSSLQIIWWNDATFTSCVVVESNGTAGVPPFHRTF